MAEMDVYSVRVPVEIKQQITQEQKDSGQSPSEFFTRIINQYKATNYGKSEMIKLQNAFDTINKIVTGLTAEAADAAAAEAESQACFISEIDSLTKQLAENEATQKDAEIKAAEELATMTNALETVRREFAEYKIAQAAAAEMQTELALVTKKQREEIAALQAALSAKK